MAARTRRRIARRRARRRRFVTRAVPLLVLLTAVCFSAWWGLSRTFGQGRPADASSLTGSLVSGADFMPAGTIAYREGDDWRHVGQVIVYFHHHPSAHPFVYIFGGSAVRECTISDRSWRSQVVAGGGPATLAFNLGSQGQTYDQDIKAVALLPKEPSIVYIGVNFGRYEHGRPGSYTDRMDRAIQNAEQADKLLVSPYIQHRYTASHILSPAMKRILVTRWLTKWNAIYNKMFAYNAGRLRALVQACQARGFHPVLLNLPLNLDIIGHRFDVQRARYGADCRAIAKRYHIPYYDWLPHIGLVNTDFLDNWHLVEPGRVKWQRQLTRATIALLKRWGMTGGSPSPSTSPSTSGEPSTSPSTSGEPTTGPSASASF